MIYPLKQFTITQRYGEKITDPQGHTGLDLWQPIGTPVYAAEGGEIMCAGVVNNSYGNPAYGNFVLIDHKNGTYTAYAHMDTVLVRTGMRVLAGAQIGTVGSTGNVTGPHLHFEVRNNSPIWNRTNFVDPIMYLNGGSEYQSTVSFIDKQKSAIDKSKKATVANSILNFRDKAGYTGNQCGQLYYGTPVEVIGEAEEKDGLFWYPVQIKGYVAVSEGDTVLLQPQGE